MGRDWTLSLKAEEDRFRYHEELRRFIAAQLPDLVGRLDGDGDAVTVPPQMDYRIRFKTVPIKLFEDEGSSGSSFRPMDETGNGVNRLTYGSAVTTEEVAAVFLRQLELPDLEFCRAAEIPLRDMNWSSVSAAGILPLLDKRRTLIAALERKARSRTADLVIRKEDLRFHAPAEGEAATNALLLAVMDVSASMQEFERRLARIFFYWTQRFLQLRYRAVEVHYVVHHTKAFEVNEREFFTVEDDGGTVCSAAYEKVLELLPHARGTAANVYVLHLTDGDNRPGDNEAAERLAARVAEQANLFGYVEINRAKTASPLLERLEGAGGRLRTFQVGSTQDLYGALRHMFSKNGWKAGNASARV